MADTGYKFAGTITQTATANLDWTNVTNVGADDGSDASVVFNSAGESSEQIICTNFGFATFPADTVIEGILIEYEVSNALALSSATIWLTKDGSASVGTSKIPSVGSTGIKNTTPTDLWGTTWTPSEIEASTFGVLFSAASDAGSHPDTLAIDYISVKVFYHFPDPPTTAYTIPPLRIV